MITKTKTRCRRIVCGGRNWVYETRLTRVNWRWEEIHGSEMNSLNLWHCYESVWTQTTDLSGWIHQTRSWNITNSTATFNLKVCQKYSRHRQRYSRWAHQSWVRKSSIKVKYRSVSSFVSTELTMYEILRKMTQLWWTSKRQVFFFRVVSVSLQILSHARHMNN